LTGGSSLELIAEAFNLLDRDNIIGQRTAFYNYDVARNLLIPQSNFGLSMDGLEAWISKVNPLDVREQQHAIEGEDIESVAQFLQSAIDVG